MQFYVSTQGLVIEEGGAGGAKLSYFPVFKLSAVQKARFGQLFDFKPKWSAAEITPYIADFVSPSDSAVKILLKNCSCANGLYSRRGG